MRNYIRRPYEMSSEAPKKRERRRGTGWKDEEMDECTPIVG